MCDLLLFVFQSASSCVLREDAVPTIFDFTMPVNNQSACNRKRARDPVSFIKCLKHFFFHQTLKQKIANL